MIWILGTALVLLWLLSYAMSGFSHVLLVIGIMAVLIGIVQSRRFVMPQGARKEGVN